MMLKVLDLFSGIGGFSLGLERTGGFETVAFCEIETYPRSVLAKHWPGVPIYDDIRKLTGDTLERDGITVDVICGGFPCQDLSFAGKRAGLEGERSGLWGEYARLIGELRPRYVIVENVPGLLSLGMGTVLGDLAALGYDAVWDCIPAAAVGAPHRRDRVWIIAHARSEQCKSHSNAERRAPASELSGANAPSQRCGEAGELRRNEPAQRLGGMGENVSDARRELLEGRKRESETWAAQWLTEPDVGRVAHGVPRRVDRLKALGNAVVPQIPEIIGRAILATENRR